MGIKRAAQKELSKGFALGILIFLYFTSTAFADQRAVEAIALFHQVYTSSATTLSLKEVSRPYALKESLFSDYALKLRGIHIPGFTAISVAETSYLQYPEGTVLSKAFYYPITGEAKKGCVADAAMRIDVSKASMKSEKLVGEIDLTRNCLIELRILRKLNGAWIPYVYRWNALEGIPEFVPGGDEVSLILKEGASHREFTYWIPSLSQCQSCHQGSRHSTHFGPIGPDLDRLNFAVSYEQGRENQLVRWIDDGLLEISEQKALQFISKSHLSLSARGYLDINCGHCHNPNGLAASSGLFLDRFETDKYKLGICKRPVAAEGADLAVHASFDVEPGSPDKSLLYQRMQSEASGMKMPELGRELIDDKGLEIISSWIASMDESCK